MGVSKTILAIRMTIKGGSKDTKRTLAYHKEKTVLFYNSVLSISGKGIM